MASLTKTEGKTGVLSYGLYKMYKNRFKYKPKIIDGEKKIIGFDQYETYGNKVNYVDKTCDANVQYHVWLRICKKFNHLKIQSILRGNIFKMPCKLGSIGVIQQQQKIKFNEDGEIIKRNMCIDWNSSIILWRKLYPECKTKEDFKKIKNKPICYYTNEHTDGRIFRFGWKKKMSALRNRSVYLFDVGKQYKNELRDLIYKNPNIQFCTKF
jgi:hypothetical protein